MKKENNISFKEAIKLNFWAYKLYFALSPWHYIISVFKLVVNSATPYIEIYLIWRFPKRFSVWRERTVERFFIDIRVRKNVWVVCIFHVLNAGKRFI